MTTQLADNVRKYRRRAGMSQEELAYAAAVSPDTVRKRSSRAARSVWRPFTPLLAR